MPSAAEKEEHVAARRDTRIQGARPRARRHHLPPSLPCLHHRPHRHSDTPFCVRLHGGGLGASEDPLRDLSAARSGGARSGGHLSGIRKDPISSSNGATSICVWCAPPGRGERGPTPLHPGAPPLGGPTSSASSTRRAANVFVRRLPCRGCACVYLCECVCLGGRVCVAAPCEPSRASHACGPPQQILGSRAGPCPASVVCVLAGQLPCFCFCFCGSRVVSVRSVRVALVSRVCLRTSQSTFVLTFPKLHMYALL